MRGTDDGGERRDRSVIGELLGNARLARLLPAFAALTLSEWTAVTAFSIYAYGVEGALGVETVPVPVRAGRAVQCTAGADRRPPPAES